MRGTGGQGEEKEWKNGWSICEDPGIIRRFFSSLIISSRIRKKRGLVNKETSDYLLSMECSPELCFCQGPNYVFAEDLFPIIFL